jgi:hypothetical protein
MLFIFCLDVLVRHFIYFAHIQPISSYRQIGHTVTLSNPAFSLSNRCRGSAAKFMYPLTCLKAARFCCLITAELKQTFSFFDLHLPLQVPVQATAANLLDSQFISTDCAACLGRT